MTGVDTADCGACGACGVDRPKSEVGWLVALGVTVEAVGGGVAEDPNEKGDLGRGAVLDAPDEAGAV